MNIFSNISPLSLFHQNQYASIDLYLLPDNEIEVNLLIIKKIKSKLVFEKKISEIDSFDELFGHLKKNIPIVLTINGKGILCKKTENLQNDTELIKQVLPNATTKDFEFQYFTNDKNISFCSIARLSLVEKILLRFKEKGFFILDINIGISSINVLEELIDTDQFKFSTEYYKYHFKNQKFVDFTINKQKKEADTINILGMEFESTFIPGFTSFLKYFIEKKQSTNHPVINTSRTDFHFYRKFRIATFLSLSILFSTLLINYFFFDHFFHKSGKLKSELSQYSKILEKKEKLLKTIQKKKETIKALGLNNNIKYAFFMDQIASKMPSSIILGNMSFQPQKKTKNNKLYFEKNKICITGKTKNPTELNYWIKEIEKLEWVIDASLGDYTFQNRENLASFNLNIIIDPDKII